MRAWFSVLINGTPSSFLPKHERLKAKRPFSAYLLILMMEVLSCFLRAVETVLINQAVSGLKIKLGKSKLLLVERIEDLEYSAYQLGCRKGTFPTKYLSMLLGTQFKSS
ncbi:hypothetical protein CK203_072115 [Vitis vinifera]|uniref:Uncharacterized protein n=1 Tax=Vitis vinifera TaxID=29760 RepID=A0A438EXF8_VITVI|nr:hypothetical protein CK203_072115 [Vitis vinifera]